jgi:hypothetical protein
VISDESPRDPNVGEQPDVRTTGMDHAPSDSINALLRAPESAKLIPGTGGPPPDA